jgi:hypothetical protein
MVAELLFVWGGALRLFWFSDVATMAEAMLQ